MTAQTSGDRAVFHTNQPGLFCWVDLAAIDADGAKTFYRRMFGWTAHEQPANGGSFTQLRSGDREVGSLYQLRDSQLARGAPSHWTPYVRVNNADDAAARAAACGGQVLVRPFDVAGVARISLILDSVGAQVGLWQPIAVSTEGDAHG